MPDADTQTAADRKRKQLYAKIAAFLIIVLIAWLKPRVEAWLAGSKGASTEVAVTDSESDAGPLERSEAITISDPEEKPSADGDEDRPKETAPDLREQISAAAEEASKKPSASPAKPTETKVAKKDSAPASTSTKSSKSTTLTKSTDTGSAKTAATSAKNKPTQTTEKKTRPLPKMATPPPGTSKKATANNDRTNPNRSSSQSKSASREDDEPPGKLTLVRGTRDEFRSTAGLMYVRGSADGHRLKHVLKHAKDNLDKPVHGVFAGERDDILAWIDRAYVKGKKGGKGTRAEDQGGRTVYTVDLGEKIGFVGGQVGKRKGHPPCRYLRLVLQNRNEVVTAYPSESL